MNQKTLYLKYRPQTLDEIIGQEELVKVLKNSIANNNISHAYLFSGGRGTGKTTAARAFAKELGIHKEDVLELDAASNNGIDNMRDLNSSANTLPYHSKYKMYILDEAHMLTPQAWNAFLKTLEEPPAHVIFVMCTTEPEKMLDTVLSRCTKFGLKSPNQEILTSFLSNVCEKERVKIEKSALQLLALSGDGSYRDSLSSLQKILAFSEVEYTEVFVSKILGVPETTAIFNFLKSLDGISLPESGLSILKQLEERSVDVNIFSKQVTFFSRLVLLSRHKLLGEKKISEEYGQRILEFTKEFLENKAPKLNSTMMSRIIEAENTAKKSSLPFLVYELFLF